MSSKNKQVKGLLLKVDNVVICEVEEIQAELGEPDCRLINPYVIKDDKSLEPFLDGLTEEVEFMMSSDKILTLAEPTPTLLKEYQDITK